jgi:hypothetical protein
MTIIRKKSLEVKSSANLDACHETNVRAETRPTLEGDSRSRRSRAKVKKATPDIPELALETDLATANYPRHRHDGACWRVRRRVGSASLAVAETQKRKT